MPRPIRRFGSQSVAHGPHRLAPPHGRVVLPQAELEITRGKARNSVRPIDGLAYLIGGAEDNDLVLADPQFPDSHSYLLRSSLGITLCWLGEGPEITVDGEPVQSTALVQNGARLRTGPFEFRVRIAWPTAPSADDETSPPVGEGEIVLADDVPTFHLPTYRKMQAESPA